MEQRDVSADLDQRGMES